MFRTYHVSVRKKSSIRLLSTTVQDAKQKNHVSSPLPKGYWTKPENQRAFFDDLGQTLEIKSLDDWYKKLSASVVLQHGGTFLFNQRIFNSSPSKALMAAYPEHNWIPWKFNKTPGGFWNDISNQRNFFDDLGKSLGISQLDDWYGKLSKEVIKSHGGNALLTRYKESPSAALMAAYPDHIWIPWKFNYVPLGFWKDKANQRKFFDEVGSKIGIKTLDDWYNNISSKLIRQHGGRGILNLYGQSPMAALMGAYPEHNWIPWKFNSVPLGYWKWKDNVKEFLNELSEKLSITTLDDWYRVDYLQLHQFGAASLLTRYHGLYQLLKQHYPHHPWDPKRFQQKGKKTQRWLAVTLKKMYPHDDILEDYMHPKIMQPTTNRPLQLDVFIPSKSLAFEYQGIQHYQEVGVFNPSKSYQQRDEEKRNLCDSNNIKLIEVPYWWNRTAESLHEMISA